MALAFQHESPLGIGTSIYNLKDVINSPNGVDMAYTSYLEIIKGYMPPGTVFYFKASNTDHIKKYMKDMILEDNMSTPRNVEELSESLLYKDKVEFIIIGVKYHDSKEKISDTGKLLIEKLQILSIVPIKVFVSKNIFRLLMANSVWIKYVETINHFLIDFCVANCPDFVRYIDTNILMTIQSVNIVKRNGLLLEFIKTQTSLICEEAVKQNAEAIKFVKELNNDIISHALIKDGRVLRYIPQYQVPPFCLLAVTSHPDAILYVPKRFMTPDVKIQALKSKYALKMVNDYNAAQIRENVELFNYDRTILENIKIPMPNEFWINGLKYVSDILNYARSLNYYLVLAACKIDPANLFYVYQFQDHLQEDIMKITYKENPERAIFYVNEKIFRGCYSLYYPKFNYCRVYYKLVNYNYVHNGFTYKKGKNINKFKFEKNNVLNKLLPGNGMSICKKEDLSYWYDYLKTCYKSLNIKYVAVVLVPENTIVINYHKYYLVESMDILKFTPISHFRL